MPSTVPTEAEHKLDMIRIYAEGYRESAAKGRGEATVARAAAMTDILAFMDSLEPGGPEVEF